MRKEGVRVDAEMLSRLSPYIMRHINRYLTQAFRKAKPPGHNPYIIVFGKPL